MRLLGSQLAIAAAAIFARIALGGAGPLTVGALRLGIAALIVAALLRRRRSLGMRSETLLALAGFALGLHFASWFGSLLYTSVAISTLLVTTTPLWTELVELMRRRRRLEARVAGSLLLGTLGIALLARDRDTPAPFGGHALLGAALAILGALAIAAYLLLFRALRARTGASTAELIARTYTWGALGLALAALIARQSPPPPGDLRAWGGILALALVSQLIGHTLIGAALADFRPTTVALATLLEGPLAAVLALVFLGEPFGPATAAGGLCVVAAAALALGAGTDPVVSSAG